MAGVNYDENAYTGVPSLVGRGVKKTAEQIAEEARAAAQAIAGGVNVATGATRDFLTNPSGAAGIYTEAGRLPPTTPPVPLASPKSFFEGGSPQPSGVGRPYGIPVEAPKEIVPTKIAPAVGGVTAQTPTNDAGYIRNENTGEEFRVKGGVASTPTAPTAGETMSAQTRDYNAELNALVDSLMKPQYNSRGKRLTNTQEFKMASALKQTQAAGVYGLEGNQIVAAATREGHGIAAKERTALERDRLTETKRLNDLRAEDVDLKRKQEADIKAGAQSLKSSDSFFKHLELVSPTAGMDETGKPIKARDVGVLDMMDSGQKFRDKVPDFYLAAQQLWDRREKEVLDAFTAGKKQYVAGDLNKTGSETYKLRQLALKRIRDRMLGVIPEK